MLILPSIWTSALAALAPTFDKLPPQYLFPAQELRQNGAAQHVAIATGDLDVDGFDDVVSTLGKPRLRVWRGRFLGSLEAAGSLAIEAPAVALDLGDVDGDGRLDVAFSTGSKVFVALGNGAAGFSTPIQVGFVNDGVAIAARDLDGDGLADVSVLSRANGSLKSWIAMASGGFAAPVTSALAQGPRDFALEDVDGDGLVDVAIADETAGRIVIALGLGDGAFASYGEYATGSVKPTAIALGDLDQDGILDVASAGEAGFDLQQRIGQGAGLFGPLVTCDQGRDIVLADWDGDGKLDRITRGQTPMWFPANGICGFGVPLDLPISATCTSLAVLDANGDGHLDLAFGAASDVDEPTGLGDDFTSVGVLAGDGSGGFIGVLDFPKPPGSSGPLAQLVEDVDGNLCVDRLVLDADGVRVSLASGIGPFFPAQEIPISGGTAMRTSDLDRDGSLDLVVATDHGLYSVLEQNGTFAQAQLVAPDTGFQGWSSGDLNGDGFEDLAILSFQAGTYARLSRGNGQFTLPIPSPDVVYPSFAGGSFHVADLDGDAYGDLIVGGGDNGIATYLGAGDGRFVAAALVPPGPDWAGIVVGDLDGDGLDDVVVVRADPFCACDLDTFVTLLSDGAGGLVLHGEYEIGRGIQQFQLHDMDLDGALDLVARLAQDVVAIAHGDGTGAFAAPERSGSLGYIVGAGRIALSGLPSLFVVPIDATATRVETRRVRQD